MPDIIIQALARRTKLPPEHRELLSRGTVDLTRKERKLYRQSLAPCLNAYREALASSYSDLCRADPSTPDTWATAIAFNILSRGYATVADTLGMMVIGRRKVSDIVKSFRPGATRRSAR